MNLTLKITQYLVKLGPKLAKNGGFSRNFSRPHFSREMSRKIISRSREKCEKLINPVIRPFLVTRFLKNYTTKFNETLHVLLGHTNGGFRKVSINTIHK